MKNMFLDRRYTLCQRSNTLTGISLGHQYVFEVYLFQFTNMVTVTSLQTGEVGLQPVCIKTSKETYCRFPEGDIRWHLANFSDLN